MSSATAVAERPAATQLPIPADAAALMRIIEKATLDPNFDVAKLERLLAVREQWAASEARNAYNVAFSAFKAEAVQIVKNKRVTDGPLKNKNYAELFSVVDAVTPMLSKHGLSAAWQIKDEKDWITVTCALRHVLGHSESVSMSGPPDAGGAKNAIQARASTVTYLERYTLKAVTGLAEQGDDADGNFGSRKMDDETFAAHLKAIDDATDEKALMRAFGAAWKEGEDMNDMHSMRKFGERKEARKKSLNLK